VANKRKKHEHQGNNISPLDYVANGEIGQVVNAWKSAKGKPQSSDILKVYFSTQPETRYMYYRNKVDEELELAYALTVHKAQGSDFNIVFLIIPEAASTLSRELLYTGLTRFKEKIVLLVQRDIKPLIELRSPEASECLKRNTNLFLPEVRADKDFKSIYPSHLIHRTQTGVKVRSKSEVIVANALTDADLSYEYELPLESKTDKHDFRLPDFTVYCMGKKFYWEHLGMLAIEKYRQAWEMKQKWYEKNGYADQLLTSEDDYLGGIDSSEIKKLIQTKILEEQENTQENWLNEVDECYYEFAKIFYNRGYPKPEFGFEIEDEMTGEILGQLEMAWPKKRVGLVTKEAYDGVSNLYKIGWQVLAAENSKI